MALPPSSLKIVCMKRFLFTLLLLFLFGGLAFWMGRQSVEESPTPDPKVAEALYTVGDKPTPPEDDSSFTPAKKAPVTVGATPLLEQINTEMTGVVAAVQPSVVNLELSRSISEEARQANPNLPPGDMTLLSVGSGVIISHEGHLVTNAHVIAGSDEILVTLYDDREFPAKVIGADVLSDIAVLRIEASDLHPLPWGDSDSIRIGETVLALGNPLANANSVSTGIISAIGRHDDDGMGRYENYIQTDASVNPGNSGGALVNIRGELIGINTAIATRSGGFEGISYAIPSELARFSVESLLKHGRVIRGFLGVGIMNIEGQEAQALKVEPGRGVMVTEVRPDTPAERAHLKPYDVITMFNGERVRDVSELRLAVSFSPVGEEVPVILYRNGEKQELPVSVDEMPSEMSFAGLLKQLDNADDEKTIDLNADDKAKAAPTENIFTGVEVKALDEATRKKYGLKPEQTGVLVEKAPEDWRAPSFPTKGDLITEIRIGPDRVMPITSPEDFKKVVGQIAPAQAVHVGYIQYISRDNRLIPRIAFLEPKD